MLQILRLFGAMIATGGAMFAAIGWVASNDGDAWSTGLVVAAIGFGAFLLGTGLRLLLGRPGERMIEAIARMRRGRRSRPG